MDAGLETLNEEKRTFYERYREAKSLSKDPSLDKKEQAKQLRRSKLLFSMYKTTCEAIQQNYPAVTKKRSRPTSSGVIPIRGTNDQGDSGMDLLLRCGVLWSDLEGQTWSSFQGYTWGFEHVQSGRGAQRLIQYVKDGIDRCTPRQKEILIEYYSSKLSVTEIAKKFKADKSTISRDLHRGLDRISAFVTAKLLIPKCIDENNKFNYFLFINSTEILTERQKELMYLLLTDGGATFEEIGDYLRRNKSTICRTANRLDDNLAGVAIELSSELSSVHIDRNSWKSVTEKTLAENMGLSHFFFYSQVRRDVFIHGIQLRHYVILKLFNEESKLSPNSRICDISRKIADLLGCKKTSIDYTRRKYRGCTVDFSTEFEKYYPVKQKKITKISNPLSCIGDADKTLVLDLIPPETYIKLLNLADRISDANS